MSNGKLSKAELLAKLQDKIVSVNVGGGNYWKPTDETSRIRIVPGVGDMGFFFQEVGQHYSLPGDKVAFCPHFTSEGEYPCPICEMCYELQSGSAEDQDLASNMWLRKRYWMNVIVRKLDDVVADTGDGPYIWNNAGPMIFTQIKSLVLNPEYGDISDVEEGIDLIVEKEGTGINTKYNIITARRDTPLVVDSGKLADILEKSVDLNPVMLTGDTEKDAELSKGKFVKLLPYDVMVDNILNVAPEPEKKKKEDVIATREEYEEKKREVSKQDTASSADATEVDTKSEVAEVDTKSEVASMIQERIRARRRRTN